MRKILGAFGILAALLAAQTALAGDNVFVIGPGMVGHPGADDPAVGYSSLALDEALRSAEAAPASALASESVRPWEEAWFQLSQMPGV